MSKMYVKRNGIIRKEKQKFHLHMRCFDIHANLLIRIIRLWCMCVSISLKHKTLFSINWQCHSRIPIHTWHPQNNFRKEAFRMCYDKLEAGGHVYSRNRHESWSFRKFHIFSNIDWFRIYYACSCIYTSSPYEAHSTSINVSTVWKTNILFVELARAIEGSWIKRIACIASLTILTMFIGYIQALDCACICV